MFQTVFLFPFFKQIRGTGTESPALAEGKYVFGGNDYSNTWEKLWFK